MGARSPDHIAEKPLFWRQRRCERRFSDAPATVLASLQRRSGSDGPSVASATLRPRRSQRRFSDDPAATIPVKHSGDDDPNVASGTVFVSFVQFQRAASAIAHR
nr:hypothetical protein CFP56_05955 [Quercus suber]